MEVAPAQKLDLHALLVMAPLTNSDPKNTLTGVTGRCHIAGVPLA